MATNLCVQGCGHGYKLVAPKNLCFRVVAMGSTTFCFRVVVAAPKNLCFRDVAIGSTHLCFRVVAMAPTLIIAWFTDMEVKKIDKFINISPFFTIFLLKRKDPGPEAIRF